MAHPRLAAALGVLGLAACGHAPVPATVEPARARPVSFEPGAWGQVTSPRFGVTFPLPDARAWRVDDRDLHVLSASREATAERVVVRAWSEDTLQSRQRCEVTSRLERLFPDAELGAVEDAATEAPPGFDTRVLVAIETGKDRALVGHVVAVGGRVKRCLFFHYTARVAAGHEDELSQRLALARAKIFGGLSTGDLAAVPRELPRVGPRER